MIRRSRPAMVLIALLTALVTAAGCAAIPDETPAAGLAAGSAGDKVAPAPDPPPNLQPGDLVRAFLDANADPTNSYAAGRPYLTKAAQAKWQPGAAVTIIQNTFNTPTEQTKPDHATVTVASETIGTLGTDKAFMPSSESSKLTVQVDKQEDGQWRISAPPAGVYITLDRFNEVYRQIRLYFLDPQKRVLVPDLRYIVSQPSYTLPSRVIDLLLGGPSNSMQGAITSALGTDAALQTGGAESGDGALLVNLTHVRDTSPANVKLIVAQIVQSLAVVTNSRIRIEQDGVALSPDRLDWRIGDLPAYDSGTSPGPDLTGLLVQDGRIKQLDDKPVNGPAGNGSYVVSTAAQSIDGSELATVSEPAPGVAQLRVGGLTQTAPVVDLTAGTLTRPTWVSTDSANDVSNEVWTVADGSRVARVIKSADGTWVARTVNSNDLSQFGQITDLRLSRDGTRAAVVANSRLIVCAVVRTPNSDTVTLRWPRLLSDTLVGVGVSVVGVDWLLQDQLVVATSSQESPVVQVSADGSPTFVRYNAANLTAPLSAVTAAPSRPVIVVDAGGIWTSSDSGSVWRVQGTNVGKASTAVPFYPG